MGGHCKQSDATWQPITLDSRLNLKSLPVCVIQQLTIQHPTFLFLILLLCYVIPSICLFFCELPSCEMYWVTALVASEEEVLLPKRRQDVRFSASSVSCVTDRSVSLVFRHRLSSHSEGGEEKYGREACMCTTCTVFWWGNQLSSELRATRTWGLHCCTANWNDQPCSERLEEGAWRQLSLLLIALIQSYTDRNTQALCMSAVTYTEAVQQAGWITWADSSKELTELSLVLVLFYATSVSDSPLLYC